MLRLALVLTSLAKPLTAGELDPASDDFALAFQGADIVMIGEVHDNPLHHAVQARLVESLQPVAIVFEMLEPAQARAVTDELRGDAVKLQAALEWEARGWPDFAMYYPVFTAASDAAIFGGALPRDAVRDAVTNGAAAVFGSASPLFGLDQPLDTAQQTEREALQMAAHCDALPEDVLPGMVEAQRLRDAALARAVVTALLDGGEGPVVVIAGNGHVREDWGIPHALRTYFEGQGGNTQITTLGQFERSAPEAPQVDHWIVTKAAEREDPCAAFR